MLIARAGDPEPGIAMVRGIAARASPSRRAANCPYVDRVSMLERLWKRPPGFYGSPPSQSSGAAELHHERSHVVEHAGPVRDDVVEVWVKVKARHDQRQVERLKLLCGAAQHNVRHGSVANNAQHVGWS